MLLDVAMDVAIANAHLQPEIVMPVDFTTGVKSVAGAIARRMPGAYTAILLTGAAARGEQTIDPSGVLASDLDFLVVLPQLHPARVLLAERQCRKLLSGYRSDIPEMLAAAASVGFAGSSPLFWRAATPFMYELRSNAICLYGSNTVLDWPRISRPAQLPAWEGIRLVANRLCEMFGALALHGRNPENPTLTARLHYAAIKQLLACSEAALIFAGEYRPTYRERSVAHSSVNGSFTEAHNALVDAAYSAKLGAGSTIFDLDAGVLVRDAADVALQTLAPVGASTPSGVATITRSVQPAAPGPLTDLLFFISQALQGNHVQVHRPISSVYSEAVLLACQLTAGLVQQDHHACAYQQFLDRAAKLYGRFKVTPQVVGNL